MLGRDLVATATAAYSVQPATRADADLTNAGALADVIDRHSPRLVVNAAAYTAVDEAESESETAYAVNAYAPSVLARLCAERGILLVHYSTEYVFSGEGVEPLQEGAPKGPINVYGASKLAGELGIVAVDAQHLVIRTQWLFGPSGKSFPLTMWDRARRRAPTRVVADQFGRPTFTPDLASATWRLLDSDARGVIHVAGSGTVSWHGLAAKIFDHHGASSALQQCATADYPTAARRPRNAVLDTMRADTIIGALPSWEDGLTRFMRAREALPVVPRDASES